MLANQKSSTIAYRVGTLSFVDTPTVYTKGSTVEGTVSTCRPGTSRAHGEA